MNKNRSSLYFIKCLTFVVGISIAIGGVYYYSVPKSAVCVMEGVEDYDSVRDKQQIISLFNADHYWLTVNIDYDIDHMLETHSPNRFESRYFGKMQIKVIREDNQVVAWTTFYMRNVYEGKILFVDVHADYRKKRYARRLMQYAECEFRRLGAHKVTLATRTSNNNAQIAYERMGYTRVCITDGFVHYEKLLK